MNYLVNYGKNFDEGMKRTLGMSGVKKSKLIKSYVGREEKKITVDEKVLRDSSYECSRYHRELETRKLRECVLNKLWDSLPPETQILSHSNDEDSDSTQSGLDEGEFEDEEYDGNTPKVGSHKDSSISPEVAYQGAVDITGIGISGTRNPQTKSCPQKPEDLKISWEKSLDFVQSIIWLKSATAKLQRVPADEFFKAFKNQWEFSPKIKSREKSTKLSHDSTTSSLTNTNQREKLDLIKNRIAIIDGGFGGRGKRDIVIPESDDSENASLQSSGYGPDQENTNTRASESTGMSAVDSGFGSEKPESAEATISSQFAIGIGSKIKKTVNFEPTIADIPRKSFNLVSRARKGAQLSSEDPKKSGEIQSSWKTLKRKHDAISGAASTIMMKRVTWRRPRLSISSVTLNHVLRSVECSKVLLDSVQVILKVLENGFDSLGYNRYALVQKEAIDAVVSIVDLLQKEKGPNSCRNEVVATVKRVLEKMLNSSDVDKLTAWEHHRLVILELCNASSVCKEVVNYLISELEELIPVATQTTRENMRASAVVMDKSYILFHSLKLVLKKHKSIAPTPVITDEVNASQKIPEVTDLWRRYWKVTEKEPDIFVTGLERLEIPDDPEEHWARVLEELVVVSTTIWPMVKILAWQCLQVLKAPV